MAAPAIELAEGDLRYELASVLCAVVTEETKNNGSDEMVTKFTLSGRSRKAIFDEVLN